MLYHKLLIGQEVALFPVRIEYAAELTAAINNAGSIKHLSYFEERPVLEVEEEREYLKRIIDNDGSYLFLIRLAIDFQKIIGTIGLHEHDKHNETVRPGIVIFPEFQGRGYGKAALELLIEFAFMELNVNLIYLNVFPENTADKLYRSTGFWDEGILKERYKLRGVYHDMRSMSLTRREWSKRNKK